jgi:hypothetical protein
MRKASSFAWLAIAAAVIIYGDWRGLLLSAALWLATQ